MISGKDLARVSATPGHTKLINMFTMNKNWRLVDLPGYGYAHVARADKSQFNQAVNDYLANRPNLSLVFALIDSGLPPQNIDLDFVQWLTSNALPFALVFTKTDQTSTTDVQANIAAFTARISAWFEQLPAIFTCSAKTGQGRNELLGVIEEAITAIRAASNQTPIPPDVARAQTKKTNTRDTRKSRPDRARPW